MTTFSHLYTISKWIRQALVVLLVLAFFASQLALVENTRAATNSTAAASVNLQDGQHRVYMSQILVRFAPVSKNPILLGVYIPGWLGSQETYTNFLGPLDEWAGKQHALVGVFHQIEHENVDVNVRHLFTLAWDNGYTPFVNLWTSYTAAQVANGSLDSQYLRPWARAFAQYADGGRRMAYIAPLPEMNIAFSSPYGRTPEAFKQAYAHIQQVFAEEGVPEESVQWVFAPNGWSARNDPGFEAYYPGHNVVEVVAFSAYNFGYNPLNPSGDWTTVEETFGPYLPRIRAMAPGKPIFIAQTGTTAYYSNGYNVSQKNNWLRAMYTYLAGQKNVRGIVYYNDSPDYDWAFYNPETIAFTGYIDGIASSAYGYLSPAQLRDQGLPVP